MKQITRRGTFKRPYCNSCHKYIKRYFWMKDDDEAIKNHNEKYHGYWSVTVT